MKLCQPVSATVYNTKERMSVGAVWGSFSSGQKVLAVAFLLVNLLLLGAIGGTLGVIYTSSEETTTDTTTTTTDNPFG